MNDHEEDPVTQRSHQDEPFAPAAAEDDTRDHAAWAPATAPPAAAVPAPQSTTTPEAPSGRALAGDDDGDDWEWEDDAPRETVPPRPRRRLVTPATVVLAGVALAGAGFVGGVQVQKSSGDAAGGGGLGGRAAMAGGPGGGLPGGSPVVGGAGADSGGAGSQADGGGAATGSRGPGSSAARSAGSSGASPGDGTGTTVGTVANVKGSRLYVTGVDGTTIEVRVGDQATVSRLAKSSAGGVHPGDTVVVQGTAGSDGTVRATTVQASADGLELGGFGARPGVASGAGTGGAGGASGGSAPAGGARSSGSSGGPDDVDQLFQGG